MHFLGVNSNCVLIGNFDTKTIQVLIMIENDRILTVEFITYESTISLASNFMA